MKTIKNTLSILSAALLILSCQKEQTTRTTDDVPQTIKFAAEVALSPSGGVKAATTFPNGGKLTIIADTLGDNWSTPLINNLEVVTTDAGPVYNFNWQTGQTQYWPLDGTWLQFYAYCPKNSAIVQSGDDLNITLPANNSATPDLIYSTIVTGKKSTPNINFGTLKHVFSQLTVLLKTVNVGPPIILGEFSVNTKSKATLDLDEQLLYVSSTPNIKYSFATQPTLAPNTTYTLQAATGVPFLLFPDVAEYNNTYIYLRFMNNVGVDIDKKINISDFITTGGAPAVLERAKNITLTITVTDVNILQIMLTGTITDWVPMGDFGITIE